MSNKKINPLVATEVHLRRHRAIQKGSRPRISRLTMSSRKPKKMSNKNGDIWDDHKKNRSTGHVLDITFCQKFKVF